MIYLDILFIYVQIYSYYFSSAPLNDALSCHCHWFVLQMNVITVVYFKFVCAQNHRLCY